MQLLITSQERIKCWLHATKRKLNLPRYVLHLLWMHLLHYRAFLSHYLSSYSFSSLLSNNQNLHRLEMKPKHEKMLASKSTHYKTSRGLEHATVILKDNVDTLEVSTVLPFMSYLLLTLTTCVYSHLLLTLQKRQMLMQVMEATEKKTINR